MVLAKNWPFFPLFILGNLGPKNEFYDILERKTGFIRYKNKKFKKSKNRDFPKELSRWFWPKIGHFSNLLFSGI